MGGRNVADRRIVEELSIANNSSACTSLIVRVVTGLIEPLHAD
jgi:hypothetical protein